MATPSHITWTERILTILDAAKIWFTKSWRIGGLMVKGAYLLDERKRLCQRIGELVVAHEGNGEKASKEYAQLVEQVKRLTRKLEVDERLIRQLRFGRQL